MVNFAAPGSRSRPWTAAALATLLGCSKVSAISLTANDPDSAKQAAATAAYGLAQWYTGNNTGDVPGNLPAPYYWWEAGATFMSFVDYWYYTGDTTYNEMTMEAIQWQKGSNDFMTPNQTRTTGNDDQSFWAFSAMDAAELKFPNPTATSLVPTPAPWLELAQAVFNEQAVQRWDSKTCGGGLRWQVFPTNAGWNYKNTISNGCLFSMGARLYRYTDNSTYAEWAERVWDWVEAVGLMSPTYQFFDGTDLTINCTQVNHIQWTYNSGVFLHGAANMWNMTSDAKWQTRIEGILTNIQAVFFKNGVMYESACEGNGKCNNDQQSFKAYLSRWMAATAQLAPFSAATIMPLLASSAQAAALQCSGSGSAAPRGSQDGSVCGLQWTNGANYDGITGPGEQMAAMQIFAAQLIGQSPAPVTNKTGGISKGNYGAGTDGDSTSLATLAPVTNGDRVGAGFLTTFVLIFIVAGAWWICW